MATGKSKMEAVFAALQQRPIASGKPGLLDGQETGTSSTTDRNSGDGDRYTAILDEMRAMLKAKASAL
jgi:hypothetical protein